MIDHIMFAIKYDPQIFKTPRHFKKVDHADNSANLVLNNC